jgi:hypothetical protein
MRHSFNYQDAESIIGKLIFESVRHSNSNNIDEAEDFLEQIKAIAENASLKLDSLRLKHPPAIPVSLGSTNNLDQYDDNKQLDMITLGYNHLGERVIKSDETGDTIISSRGVSMFRPRKGVI